MQAWKRQLAWAGLGAVLLGAGGAHAQSLRDAADLRDRFVGAAVNMTPFRNEAAYRDTLGREFNMLVAENAFKFDALHPSRTTFNFTDADALVQFAEANNMAVRGHTLVWHSQLPGWLTGGTFTRDEVIAIMREHIQTVVGRYRGRIRAWDVVNEAIDDGNGQLRTSSFWHQRIGPEYVRMAFEFARDADPGAVLYYNDFSAEGLGTKSDGVFNLLRGLRDQGVPVHGVGWQMHQINPFRIQAAHRTNLRRLADLGLEISITEMDLRIQLPTDGTKLQQQALGYGDAMQLCVEEPSCKALVTWGFTDKYSWVPGFFQGFGDALIFDVNYQRKPAHAALLQALDGGPSQPPPVPTGLTATAGNGQVQLGWSASPGATSYNVKRSTTSSGPYATAGSASGTSFTNTGLTNGTLYFFVVTAVNAAGESANSLEVSARPQLPAGFTLSASPSSLTLARGGSASSTVTIARTGGFSAGVAFTASGLPSGVSASFSPASTTGGSTMLMLAASSTAAAGTATVTVTGNGGGLSRTTTVSLTVPGDTGTGGVTVTPAVTANGAWFNEQVIRLSNPNVTLTALSVTIVVQRTTGVGFSGQYNTVGGQILQSNSSTSAAVTYRFNLAAGQTLGTGTGRTFAAQTSGQGTVHPTAGDTFTVTYTTGGVTFTQTGHY